MENGNVICKADIRAKSIKIFLIIWLVIATALVIFLSLPSKYILNEGNPYGEINVTHYHLFGFEFKSRYEYVTDSIAYNWDYHTDYIEHYAGSTQTEWYGDEFFWGLLCVCAIYFVPLFLYLVLFNTKEAERCSLELTEKGIYGNRKTIFSNKQLNLPMDKVDNVMIKESVLDKLRGGKTVAVRSASGLVKFPWVQNADEFVSKTLAKIEEFKQTVKSESKNIAAAVAQTVSSSGGSNAAKIKELKELLDSGLISQEEFEEKRKELLKNM